MVVTQLDDARPPLPACGVELVFVGSLFLQRQGHHRAQTLKSMRDSDAAAMLTGNGA